MRWGLIAAVIVVVVVAVVLAWPTCAAPVPPTDPTVVSTHYLPPKR